MANIRRQFLFGSPFWHHWSYFSILNLSVFYLADKYFAISLLIIFSNHSLFKIQKNPQNRSSTGILRLDTTLSCDNKSIFRLYYSMIVATVPDPTVRPPSRIATRGAQTSAKPFFTLFPVSETASAKILPRTFSTHSSRVRRRTLCAPVLSRSPRRADPPA